MTEADRPAPEPKNSASAGAKSPVDIPCRYISGSTSATLGLLRHHGGTMVERNRKRSPVSGVDPAVVNPRRLDLDGAGRGGDGAGLGMAVAHDQPVPRLVELAGQRLDVSGRLGLDSGGQHPARSLTDRSHPARRQLPPLGRRHRQLLSTSACPSSPASHRQRISFWSTRKVRRALRTDGRSTGSGYNSATLPSRWCEDPLRPRRSGTSRRATAPPTTRCPHRRAREPTPLDRKAASFVYPDAPGETRQGIGSDSSQDRRRADTAVLEVLRVAGDAASVRPGWAFIEKGAAALWKIAAPGR